SGGGGGDAYGCDSSCPAASDPALAPAGGFTGDGVSEASRHSPSKVASVSTSLSEAYIGYSEKGQPKRVASSRHPASIVTTVKHSTTASSRIVGASLSRRVRTCSWTGSSTTRGNSR